MCVYDVDGNEVLVVIIVVGNDVVVNGNVMVGDGNDLYMGFNGFVLFEILGLVYEIIIDYNNVGDFVG